MEEEGVIIAWFHQQHAADIFPRRTFIVPTDPFRFLMCLARSTQKSVLKISQVIQSHILETGFAPWKYGTLSIVTLLSFRAV